MTTGGQHSSQHSDQQPGLSRERMLDAIDAQAGLVRFAFCKQVPVIEEACRRLAAFTG